MAKVCVSFVCCVSLPALEWERAGRSSFFFFWTRKERAYLHTLLCNVRYLRTKPTYSEKLQDGIDENTYLFQKESFLVVLMLKEAKYLFGAARVFQ